MPKRQGRKRKMKGKGLKSLLQRGNKFLRDTKLVSRLAGTLRDAGVAPKYTGAVAGVAGKLGYGRKRKRKMKGKGKVMDWIRQKALPFLKRTKLISGVARTLGSVGVPYAGTVGNVASSLGYGRRGRQRRTTMTHSRSAMRGRGLYLGGIPGPGMAYADNLTFSRGNISA